MHLLSTDCGSAFTVPGAMGAARGIKPVLFLLAGGLRSLHSKCLLTLNPAPSHTPTKCRGSGKKSALWKEWLIKVSHRKTSSMGLISSKENKQNL